MVMSAAPPALLWCVVFIFGVPLAVTLDITGNYAVFLLAQVDLVVNMEIPSHGKDYIHRVGRTARAGRAGRSIAFVTQV